MISSILSSATTAITAAANVLYIEKCSHHNLSLCSSLALRSHFDTIPRAYVCVCVCLSVTFMQKAVLYVLSTFSALLTAIAGYYIQNRLRLLLVLKANCFVYENKKGEEGKIKSCVVPSKTVYSYTINGELVKQPMSLIVSLILVTIPQMLT